MAVSLKLFIFLFLFLISSRNTSTSVTVIITIVIIVVVDLRRLLNCSFSFPCNYHDLLAVLLLLSSQCTDVSPFGL